MTTQNKIAAAVIEAIKSGHASALKDMGIVRRENSTNGNPRYSITVWTIRAIGLDEEDVAMELRGRFGRMDGMLYFVDWTDCKGFCKKVSDMIKENERA